MQRVRDTAPEMALRRELWGRGLRYRVHYAPVSGIRRSADIVFTKAHVAVFVDGCFWHHCPRHGSEPKANGTWWEQKFTRTVERDRETDQLLRAAGWKVIRVWEHEVPDRAVRKVIGVLGLGVS
jgi:DNA mismatch endonuclease (patch repair protein)